MSETIDVYLREIRAADPGLTISSAELNGDGMANAVVVVNGELAFRFPKTAAARGLQRYEAELLALIGPRLPVAVPQVEALTERFARYRFIPGEPLYQHRLLAAAAADRDRVLDQLGGFLAALHGLPLEGLPAPPWQTDAPASAHGRALARLGRVRERLYPHLWRDQRDWVEQLHAPLAGRALDLDAFTPRLIHADLASYHLLIEPGRWALSGVLDFGTAGAGDPAVDLALLLNSYGEGALRRIGRSYPVEVAALDRARFFAGAIELEWALAGLDGDPSMYFVHLGRARDTLPIGARWA